MNRPQYSVGSIGDQLEQYASIATEALRFSDRALWLQYVERIGRDNLRGVFRGDDLVGGLTFYRIGQWFGGSEIGCAGISGVAIDPVARGRGACAEMLRSVLRELRDDGVPLASLYASTQSLYRSVGFEHAGTQNLYSIPINSLRPSQRHLTVQRFDSPPIEMLDRLARERAARSNGNLSRTHGLWMRLIDPHDGQGTVTYLFGEPERPEGYVILRRSTRDQPLPHALASTDVAVNSAAAIHGLFTLIHDHRSMCDRFEWYGPSNDPLILLANEQWVQVRDSMRWMLRIVDIQAALAARGYPRAIDGALELEIDDECLPENAGRWLVEIKDGSATVRPGGSGKLRMSAQTLAPIFSSFYTARQLAELSLVESQDECQVELATAAFSGDPAWMTEIF